MIKQILQIGSADSFFNNHTSLYQFRSIHPFIPQLNGEFYISYQNRLVIKHLAILQNFIRFGDDKFINLKDVCMSKIYHPKTQLFGIKLAKNGVSLDIVQCNITFDFYQKSIQGTINLFFQLICKFIFTLNLNIRSKQFLMFSLTFNQFCFSNQNLCQSIFQAVVLIQNVFQQSLEIYKNLIIIQNFFQTKQISTLFVITQFQLMLAIFYGTQNSFNYIILFFNFTKYQFEKKYNNFQIKNVKLASNIFGLSDKWIEIMRKYTIQFDFISKYQLLNKLGEGYSIIVYRARNKITKQEYAVKIFDKKRLLINQYEAKKFFKELKIIRCLDNSNLLKFYEIYESSNHIYIILELLRGEKLTSITTKQQPLNEQEIITIMKPLFQAVQYLHDLNIYHRHIDFQSILFKNKNDLSEPCLIDFNQAEQIEFGDQEDQSTILVNPEKQIKYNIKFDVLSLGLVMYNLLTKGQYQTKQAINDAMMYEFKGVQNLQFVDPPLSDLCFDFINIIFEHNSKFKTCKQLLTHPIFDQENLKTSRNLEIQLIGILNQNSSRFRINSKQSQRSPKAIKTISLKKAFNVISKSPQEKANLNIDYLEPPQSHLMFRRGSRQKRTLNFDNHNEISNELNN